MRRRDFIRGLIGLGVSAAVADHLAFIEGLGRSYPSGAVLRQLGPVATVRTGLPPVAWRLLNQNIERHAYRSRVESRLPPWETLTP